MMIDLGKHHSGYGIRTLKSQRDQPVWLPKQPHSMVKFANSEKLCEQARLDERD